MLDHIRKTSEGLFIVGCPRSGTTLLRLILGAHPNIAIPDETGIFHILYDYPGKIRKWKSFEELKNVLVNKLNNTFSTEIINNVIDSLRNNDFNNNPRNIIEILFHQYLRRQGKAIWGDKTPTHAYHIKDIYGLFPKAKVIFLIRDPRAVFASMKKYALKREEDGKSIYFWMTKDPFKSVMLWLDCLEAINKYRNRINVVKYEDLVTQPESTIKFLFENYLKLPFDKAIFKKYAFNKSKRSGEIEEWHKQTTKVIDPSIIHKWKEELSQTEIDSIERNAKNYMIEFGYEFVNRPSFCSFCWGKRKKYKLRSKLSLWKQKYQTSGFF